MTANDWTIVWALIVGGVTLGCVIRLVLELRNVDNPDWWDE